MVLTIDYRKIDGSENGYGPVSTKVGIGKETAKHRGGLWYSQENIDRIGRTWEGSMHDVEHKCHHVDREPKIGHPLSHLVACQKKPVTANN